MSHKFLYRRKLFYLSVCYIHTFFVLRVHSPDETASETKIPMRSNQSSRCTFSKIKLFSLDKEGDVNFEFLVPSVSSFQGKMQKSRSHVSAACLISLSAEPSLVVGSYQLSSLCRTKKWQNVPVARTCTLHNLYMQHIQMKKNPLFDFPLALLSTNLY